MEKTKTTLPVIGMHCANCAIAIEKTLTKNYAGISKAEVNLATDSVYIEYDPSQVKINDMAESVKKAGYELVIESEDETGDVESRARADETRRQKKALIIGILFTLPLFFLSMGSDAGIFSFSGEKWFSWLMLVLASPVQFYTGFDYYINGFKSLRNRSANMDVLVALGSSIAYFYSVFVLVFNFHGHL
jgi:Cu+-exporting ATPase